MLQDRKHHQLGVAVSIHYTSMQSPLPSRGCLAKLQKTKLSLDEHMALANLSAIELASW